MSTRLGLIVLSLAALAGGGCTGSEVVNSGNGLLAVSTEADNTTRFEQLFYRFSQLETRPTDPDASAALGSLNIDILNTSLILDTQFPEDPPDPSSTPSGEYSIERIRMRDIDLNDADQDPPAGAPTCYDYVRRLRGRGDFNFDGSDTFAVDALSGGTLTVVVDIAKLKDQLEASSNCGSCSPAGCQLTGVYDPGCECDQQGFNESMFVQMGPDFFSFR